MPAIAPPRGRRLPLRPPAGRISEGPAADWAIAIAIAAVLCLVTFYAKGGLRLETMTVTEMALTCAAGRGVGLAVLLAPARRGLYGVWSVGLLLAFAALTAVSVVWSVQPDESWQ